MPAIEPTLQKSIICSLSLAAGLLAIPFTGERLLDSEFLAWLQVKGMPFDFPDDVLLYNLSLEAAERVLNGLAFLEPYFSQMAPPLSTQMPILRSVFTASSGFSEAIS
jgi:hypothetical protein